MKIAILFVFLLSVVSRADHVVSLNGSEKQTDSASQRKGSIIRKTELEKTPKSLFLIKKIQISSDVGEPQFNPQQAQLRTVINDSCFSTILRNSNSRWGPKFAVALVLGSLTQDHIEFCSISE